jgi:hypothetical protein
MGLTCCPLVTKSLPAWSRKPFAGYRRRRWSVTVARGTPGTMPFKSVGFSSCRAMQLLARFALDAHPLPTSDAKQILYFRVLAPSLHQEHFINEAPYGQAVRDFQPR